MAFEIVVLPSSSPLFLLFFFFFSLYHDIHCITCIYPCNLFCTISYSVTFISLSDVSICEWFFYHSPFIAFLLYCLLVQHSVLFTCLFCLRHVNFFLPLVYIISVKPPSQCPCGQVRYFQINKYCLSLLQ
uniref:Uncharacterized protein n=1 Tax=Rhipicephalus pulchellus TaxID=72859 RepID=L7LZE1_RHIPC